MWNKIKCCHFPPFKLSCHCCSILTLHDHNVFPFPIVSSFIQCTMPTYSYIYIHIHDDHIFCFVILIIQKFEGRLCVTVQMQKNHLLNWFQYIWDKMLQYFSICWQQYMLLRDVMQMKKFVQFITIYLLLVPQ